MSGSESLLSFLPRGRYRLTVEGDSYSALSSLSELSRLIPDAESRWHVHTDAEMNERRPFASLEQERDFWRGEAHKFERLCAREHRG